MTEPGSEEPDYWMFHATVVDAIRYDVGGTPAPTPGAYEALVRLGRQGPGQLVDFDEFDLTYLESVVADAVRRGAGGELPLDDAAHAALDQLRAAGVPVPPRAPEDPYPDLSL